MRNLSVLTYSGPPDYVTVDQGSAYVSAEMKSNMASGGITLSEAYIESPGSMGVFERYYALLRAGYGRKEMDYGSKLQDCECLHMAVYAFNAIMGL